MQRAPILIFDSGLGGLSIYQKLVELAPDYPYLYLADQGHFPYGDKAGTWLAARLTELAAWFATQNPCLVVLACNTATVNAIGLVRQVVPVPVVGVEPVSKPLHAYAHPLILATAATARAASQAESTPIPFYTPGHLATAIELGDTAGITAEIAAVAAYVRENGVDALGLSCTHYPLVKNELQRALPDIPIIEPSLAVARHAHSLLPAPPVGSAPTRFVTTGSVLRLAEGVARYLGQRITAEHIEI